MINVKFWKRLKVQKYFDTLCKVASKPSVDWKKFRELDKKGHFSSYSNSYLAVMFLKRKRKEQGLCFACGKEPVVIGKLKCTACLNKGKG